MRPTLLVLALAACTPPRDLAGVDPAARATGVAAWVTEGGYSDARFGDAVAWADVNGDGYDDVVVGAYGYDASFPGQGAAFVHLGSATGPDTVPAWSIVGDGKFRYLGMYIAGLGDVNGDGYEDVAINRTDKQVGRVDVYHGSATGLGALPSWSFAGDSLNYADGLASAGDVNGDGYADLVVGSSIEETDGRAYVFHGSATGLGAGPVWVGSPRSADPKDDQGARYGTSIASAGDVNGDGYGDLVVGSTQWGPDYTGKAWVYFGSATGLALDAGWTATGTDLDGFFGSAVVSAGDVDGDGYDDLAISAPAAAFDAPVEGTVSIFRGGPAGPEAAPAVVLAGGQLSASFGGELAGGDVDEDGYSDLVVGASRHESGEDDEGVIFLYRGSPAGLATTAAWSTQSNQVGANLGCSVRLDGDGDGDGAPDLLAGAEAYDAGATDEGTAYVFLGGCEGPWADDTDLDLTKDCEDCAPEDASIHPGVAETCDGVDQDCDGAVDEDAVDVVTWYADADADGFTDAAITSVACEAPAGFAAPSATPDCDELAAGTFPGADETCDGVDQDCDGSTDEDATDAPTWYADADADGFTDPAVGVAACTAPAGFAAANGEDCDDADGAAFPGAPETADDGVDQDCDGQDAVTPPTGDDTDVPGAADTDVPDADDADDGKGGCSSAGARAPWLGVLGLLALRRRRS